MKDSHYSFLHCCELENGYTSGKVLLASFEVQSDFHTQLPRMNYVCKMLMVRFRRIHASKVVECLHRASVISQMHSTPITKTLEGKASQRKQHLLRSSIFLEAAFNNECEEALDMYMDAH